MCFHVALCIVIFSILCCKPWQGEKPKSQSIAKDKSAATPEPAKFGTQPANPALCQQELCHSVASESAIQCSQLSSEVAAHSAHQISWGLTLFLQEHKFSLVHPISNAVTVTYLTTDLEKLRDKNMWSPLQKACHKATTGLVGALSDIIKELIEAASTDTLNGFIPATPGNVAGWAPVHLLATTGCGLPLLKLLVEKKADVTLEQKGVLQYST